MPASNHPQGRRARQGGSRYTVFRWMGKPLLFARQVAHTSPAPVGNGAVAIQPLDAIRPVEIITPAAIGMGTLTLELYETYSTKVWDEFIQALPNSADRKLNDLADIFQLCADIGTPLTLTKYVIPPANVVEGSTSAANNLQPYYETYNNCNIINMMDGETIEIGTMEVLKQMVIAYTHVTRNDGANYDRINGNGSAFANGDADSNPANGIQ